MAYFLLENSRIFFTILFHYSLCMSTYKIHFTFSLSDTKKTDLQLVSVLDSRTGYVVRTALNNSGKQTPSIMAFAGARFSRSRDSSEDIFAEIKSSGKNAQEKLAAIFRNYGHASVADMSQLFAYIENIPMIYEAKFFYETSLGGGQARSTRYQDFNNPNFVSLDQFVGIKESPELAKESIIKDLIGEDKFSELNEDFFNLQKYSLEKYNHWVKILTDRFIEVYGVNRDSKKEMGALTARVFDTARYFLLSGLTNRTSLAWITSAREWARIISMLKSCKDINLNYLGEQLEALFAPDQDFAESIGYLPEAPDLIRYTQRDETTSNNLQKLQDYLSDINFSEKAEFRTQFKYREIKVKLFDESYSGSLKAIAQNIQTLYPNIKEKWLFSWLKHLDKKQKQELSHIIFSDFDHHKQMGNQFRTNVHSYLLTCSIAEARDLNRHRAWGRFIPVLSTEENLMSVFFDGYTLPLYLSDNPELSQEKTDFEEDLLGYYTLLRKFLDKIKNQTGIYKNVFWEVLPFAHIMKMWLHGSPKEISYMTKLRVRPGGHINYRTLAYLIAEKAAKADPFLEAIKLNKPNPCSSSEFLDRS